jgi:hypothetical protein
MTTVKRKNVPTRTVDVGGVQFAYGELVGDRERVSDVRVVEQVVVPCPLPLNAHVASSGLDRSLLQVHP